MSNQTFQVQGMTCQHCVKAVEQALAQVAGVQTVAVDLNQAQVTVDFDDTQTNAQALAQAIAEEGYSVQV